jgi:hypothetical protein
MEDPKIYYMDVNRFISGTDLMKLCDLCVFESEQSKNWGKCCKYVYNIDRRPTEEDVERIRTAKRIFIKRLHRGQDYVLIFMHNFYNILSEGISIISHCSDHGIYEKDMVLDLPKIKNWYGINCHVRNQKVVPLPIGMTTCNKRHGDMGLLQKVIDKKCEKKRLLYVNCDIRSNPGLRKPIVDLMKSKGYSTIVGEKPLDQEEYWTQLASSKFVISPPGNGVDCHRIWESIYLGTIPVVAKSPVFKTFSHLPILFIDDWNEVSDKFLERKYAEFSQKTFDTEMCYMDYWKQIIV